MKKLIVLSFLLSIALLTYSQHESLHTTTIKYGTINQAGLLSGSQGESGMLETINGITINKWFTGVGVGLDYYAERDIPMFIDVRRDISNSKNTPFVYTDAGINLAWLNDQQKRQRSQPANSPGLFYDLGAGWKLGGRNKRAFIVSGGYSFKHAKERLDQTIFNPALRISEPAVQYMNYKYRRIVIKVGFQL